MKKINKNRIRILKDGDERNGTIIYWMGRDQRSTDNWALLYAQEKALEHNSTLIVIFCIVPTFLEATLRQYEFMLDGLKTVEQKLNSKNIPFYVLFGNPITEIPKFIKEKSAALLITDFEPLNLKKSWKKLISKKISVPFHEVDAHNIIPCWKASDKQEFAAHTLRKKINRLLPEYFEDYPKLKKQRIKTELNLKNNWDQYINKLEINRNIRRVDAFIAGEDEAMKACKKFIKKKLTGYNNNRNDPAKEWQSNLSPYLHFGQISSLTVAKMVKSFDAPKKDKDSFLEELIVRKELSDNFCFYNRNYDNFKGIPQWAKESLNKHAKDIRKYRYSLKNLEEAATHDDAWNAAQREMVKTGKMHGYMRMYWGKKILEWSSSPKKALKNAIYLNNKYELDGRDPNGYVGILWAIGGLHDRPWAERQIFGKVRYMNERGLRRKFKIDKYIEKYL